jgi:ribosomal protein L40E
MGALLPMLFAIAGGVCLLFVLLALWQSLRTLLGETQGLAGEPEAVTESGRRQLLREKDTLLGAIRELRFEHDLGKLSDADLAQLEQGYRGRAREVLQELDEELEPHRAAARALIEQARSNSTKSASAESAKTGTADAAAEPRATQATLACGACGTRNDTDASFCKKCGGKLGAEASA